jgi:hypothetical protein
MPHLNGNATIDTHMRILLPHLKINSLETHAPDVSQHPSRNKYDIRQVSWFSRAVGLPILLIGQ